MFGRIDILADLAATLQEIVDRATGDYQARLQSYDVISVLRDLRLLNRISHGKAPDAPFSEAFYKKVVDPYIKGEQKDVELLLTFWSRDEDARLRDALPVFGQAANWNVNEDTVIRRSRSLNENQMRYLAGVIRRMSNMLATAYKDKASDMMKVQDLAVRSTSALIEPVNVYLEQEF